MRAPEPTVYKNLAIFWQDYFLGTGKIFLETGKIFLEMARFNFRSLANSKKNLAKPVLKKSCQKFSENNLA